MDKNESIAAREKKKPCYISELLFCIDIISDALCEWVVVA